MKENAKSTCVHFYLHPIVKAEHVFTNPIYFVFILFTLSDNSSPQFTDIGQDQVLFQKLFEIVKIIAPAVSILIVFCVLALGLLNLFRRKVRAISVYP